MSKKAYYIYGQNGEHIVLKKDVDGGYSYCTSLEFEDAEIMDLKFAKEVLANLNEGEDYPYFKICKVKKGGI